MANGEWKVEGGKWKVEGGRSKVEGRRWQVVGDRWQVASDRWQVSHSRQPQQHEHRRDVADQPQPDAQQRGGALAGGREGRPQAEADGDGPETPAEFGPRADQRLQFNAGREQRSYRTEHTC